MKNLYYIIIVFVFIATSCSKEVPCSDDLRVRISAALPGNYSTKTPYEYTSPSPSNPLDVEVWASTTENIFENGNLNGSDNNHTVSLHAKASFKSGEPQLLSDIIYSKDETPIFFIGLYPQNGWSTTDGSSSTFSFNGTQDLLFAPQVSGCYGQTDDSGNEIWPELHFYHLLTYLKIEMIADNETVANAWGNVTSLKINRFIENEAETIQEPLNNNISIDLSNSINKENGLYNASGVTFSHSSNTDKFFNFYTKGTNNIFPSTGGYSLKHKPEDAEEVAYSMIAPVLASANADEFEIEIITERKTVTVPLNFMSVENEEFVGSTMGKLFEIQLYFTAGDNIMVSAVCNEWTTGGTGTGILDE